MSAPLNTDKEVPSVRAWWTAPVPLADEAQRDTDTCPCNNDPFALGPCADCRAEFERRRRP